MDKRLRKIIKKMGNKIISLEVKVAELKGTVNALENKLEKLEEEGR